MAGKCGCGSGSALRLDPAACNTLQRTASGLLVPRAEVAGVDLGTAAGAARSVDIDVTAPTAGACPETWTVGARLTPVSGQTTGIVSLQSVPYDSWTAVPGAELTLPEAGIYEVIADVQGGIIMPGSVANAWLGARLFDVTAGAVVPLSTRTVTLFSATPADGVTHTLHGNASAAALYQVAGPVTIRVEGLKHVDSGITTGDVVFVPAFRFTKTAD